MAKSRHDLKGNMISSDCISKSENHFRNYCHADADEGVFTQSVEELPDIGLAPSWTGQKISTQSSTWM